jgi:hypothetical protein
MSALADSRVLLPNVTNVPRTIFAAGVEDGRRSVTQIVVTSLTADAAIIFRTITGSVSIFIVAVKAGTTQQLDGFITNPAGLECVALTAVANCHVTVFYG